MRSLPAIAISRRQVGPLGCSKNPGSGPRADGVAARLALAVPKLLRAGERGLLNIL